MGRVRDLEGNYVTYEGKEIVIYNGENTLPNGLRVGKSRVYLMICEYRNGVPKPESEYSYRVYNYEGELIGATVVDLRNNRESYPHGSMFVDSDGTLYVMSNMQDGVYITKPNLRTEYVSHLGESAESGN